MNKDFLLEIGSEEIPAGYLNDAINFIRQSFETFVKENRLQTGEIKTSFTPRRLVLLVADLPAKQDDLSQLKLGPNVKIAYKEDGSLSPAAAGFLRSSKANAEDVFVQNTEKGDFIAVQLKQAGLPTEQLLQEWISRLLPAIPFPKKMKWGSGKQDFARPIRWLVALWGDDILPVNSYGITSDRISYGNRYLGLDIHVSIDHPRSYFSALQGISVLADRNQRFQNIRHQLEHIFDGQPYQVELNETLLQTVTDIVEFPTAVIAEFDPKYLILPAKIITSTISTNQKYFAVNDLQGNLTNKFVFISNGNPSYSEIIKQGNQKVVTPRLEDALWYYHEDTKKPLESYVQQLQNVVFQAKLGTVYDKTMRIAQLAAYMAKALQLSAEIQQNVARTALLCKADLVTNMLGEKEFTKLQGYIGKHYALASGEPDIVAEGIYEHYLPRGQNDDLPFTQTGALVAIADKIDTVCGIIGIGMLPSGSADPFALRRAANGVVQILAERKYDLDVVNLIQTCVAGFADKISDHQDTIDKVSKFFHQRVSWLLQQYGIDYDVTDSVMHINFARLLHLLERANAVQEFKTNPDFVKLVIGFKRVSNIIKDESEIYSIQQFALTEPAEQALFIALNALENQVDAALERMDYTCVLRHLVDMRPAIDRFFDDVLVNSEEVSLRNNRYALLQAIRQAFLKVADLSLLVVEGDKK